MAVKSPWTATCPIRTNHEGKPQRHNWQRVHEVQQSYSTTGTDWGGLTSKVRCNFCDETREDIHLCDQFVSYYVGNWPHYKNCDKRAENQSGTRLSLLGHASEGCFWFCNAHTPEALQAKQIERDRREKVRWDKQMHSFYYGSRGQAYENVLVELVEWGKANADLVESDEWLNSILKKVKLPQ